MEANTISARVDASAPYNLFLNKTSKVTSSINDPLAISFKEILQMDDLKSVLLLTYTLNVEWLNTQFIRAGRGRVQRTVIYKSSYQDGSNENQTLIQVEENHSKLMILSYKDRSIRIVVSTANLTPSCWDDQTQGIWISPKCKTLPKLMRTAGDSETHFKRDLIRYLENFKEKPSLSNWITRVEKTDFEQIRVVLITKDLYIPHSLEMLAVILKANLPENIPNECPIVAQSSALGKYDLSQLDAFRSSMGTPSVMPWDVPLKIIYPTQKNAKNGTISGRKALTYGKEWHDNFCEQMENMFHKWSAKPRTKLLPHLKTYFRYSGDELYWFCLTSANFSKTAWYSEDLRYELGIIFFPKFFGESDTFQLRTPENKTGFPLPYDWPLVRYNDDDEPYFSEP